MALMCVLVLNKWRRFAPPDKHTRKSKQNCLNEKMLRQNGRVLKQSRAVFSLFLKILVLFLIVWYNKSMEKFIIIDGNSLINRAYYGLPNLKSLSGKPCGAIFGFINMMISLISSEKPKYLVCVFDAGKHTFRHNMYAEYKGTRDKMPEDLHSQLVDLKDLLRAMGIMIKEIPEIEADDIIGTVSRICDEHNVVCNILTGDKDDLQLATKTSHIKLIVTKMGKTENEDYNRERVLEEYGIEPNQLIDLKGLMGDASDNIPGIPGVGEKTAVKLLQEYGTVENVLLGEHKGKLKEKIENGKESALMSKEIATIFKDVPLPFTLEDTNYKGIDVSGLKEYFTKYEMRSLLSRLNDLVDTTPKESIEYEVVESFINDFEEILKNKSKKYKRL